MNMPNNIFLSFCIPTYNRSFYLQQTLENLVNEINESGLENVEIVIVDGNSSDNTKYLVNNFQKKYQYIKFFPKKTNGGVSRDYYFSIKKAKGKFCWLMSSDDFIDKGSLKKVITEIKMNQAEIYLMNRKISHDFKSFRNELYLSKETPSRTFFFYTNKDFNSYFSSCNTIGGLFSYAPSIIFERSKYLNIKNIDPYLDTLYGHIYVLFSMLSKSAHLRYLKESLVLTRIGNDSWMHKGMGWRLLQDLTFFLSIANFFFNKDKNIKKKFLKVFTRCKYYGFLSLLKSKIQSNDLEWKEIKNCLYIFGFSPLLIRFVEISSKLKPLILMYFYFKKKNTKNE
jgi:abequosyltransferase